MQKILFTICLIALCALSTADPQSGLGGSQLPPKAAAGQPAPQAPAINWGNCPQLEPTETEKREKGEIIKVCLERIPLPENITQSTVEAHRAEVAKCALQREGWFTEHGDYKYEKAESEIKKKRLDAGVQQKILAQHQSCKQEATSKFAKTEETIAQIQLYQSCMDYHISQICGIQITYPGNGREVPPPGAGPQ